MRSGRKPRLGLTAFLAALRGVGVVAAVTVYENPHYTVRITTNVSYCRTLVHCTNQTDQSTCQEVDMWLDVWQPTNTTDGPFPVVMSVHGGGFVSGDPKPTQPPNSYFAERGFVAFGVQYRLARDKGVYPRSLEASLSLYLSLS